MLRKWILLIGGAALTSLILSFFFVNRASEDPMLARKILERAESGTTVDVIEESLNVEFKGSINGIDFREDIFLLVFAKGNHAIKTVVLSRKVGNYYEKNGMLTPKNDLLIIKKLLKTTLYWSCHAPPPAAAADWAAFAQSIATTSDTRSGSISSSTIINW